MIDPKSSVEKAEQYQYPAPFLSLLKKYGVPKEKALKLDYNEPTIKPNPRVLNALGRYIKKGQIQRYPDGGCGQLRYELAKYTGANPENIIVGNGSDEILKAIAFAYISENDEVVVPIPNYSMFIINAQLCGARIIEVSCSKELEFDINSVINAVTKNTKVIYLSNPNSPIGSVFKRLEIIKLLEQCRKCLVVIDEAYFEFYGKSACDLIDKYGNLIVTRTFSKAFSLASLRLGYAVSNEKNVRNMAKVMDPESVNSLAQIAGIESLKNFNYTEKFVKETIKSRNYLSDGLRKLGLQVYPANSNFILARFPKKFSSAKICEELESKGIFLRDRSKIPLLENCVRIGVPLLKESKILVSEISKIMNPLLIFDIDGVLVDVSKSYRAAIKKTAGYFISGIIGDNEITEYKNKGGYNNDWDLTEALIKSKGKIIQKQKIIERFQRYYRRLRDDEKWLLDKRILKRLSEKYNLAILTGRPKGEADYALRKNKAKDYFSAVIAMEDVSKQKPNPEGLLKITGKFGNNGAYYFGDSVDDMKAAVLAGVKPIGVLAPQDKSELLKNLLAKNGAKEVIRDINKIEGALK